MHTSEWTDAPIAEPYSAAQLCVARRLQRDGAVGWLVLAALYPAIPM